MLLIVHNKHVSHLICKVVSPTGKPPCLIQYRGFKMVDCYANPPYKFLVRLVNHPMHLNPIFLTSKRYLYRHMQTAFWSVMGADLSAVGGDGAMGDG